MTEPNPQITDLLHAWRAGDAGALDKLVPLVYSQMHTLAARYMRRERQDHTLRPTALINEAYLKLLHSDVAWEDRVHFLAIASVTMRRILVDHARSNNRVKRGSGVVVLSLDYGFELQQVETLNVLDLDIALTRLFQQDSRCAKVVEMFYFGGVNCEDVAKFLGVSTATVNRNLKIGKAWLKRELNSRPSSPRPVVS